MPCTMPLSAILMAQRPSMQQALLLVLLLFNKAPAPAECFRGYADTLCLSKDMASLAMCTDSVTCLHASLELRLASVNFMVLDLTSMCRVHKADLCR